MDNIYSTCSTGTVMHANLYPMGFATSDLHLSDYHPIVKAEKEWITVCQYCGTEWTESLCPGCGGNARIKIKIEKESD